MRILRSAKYLLNTNWRRSTNYWLNRLEVAIKRDHLLSHPIELCIETTNHCNSKCVMCTIPVHQQKSSIPFGYMSWETFLRTRPFWKTAKEIDLGGNGEPFLNLRYLDMARELKKEGCFVHCYSNGLLIDQNISKRLVAAQYDLIGVSMGGATAQTYRLIRGVDGFHQVVKNLRKLKEIKKASGVKKPEIRFNIAAMNSVLGELGDLVRLASELEVTSIDMFHLFVYFDHVRQESPWLNIDAAQEKMEHAKEVAKELGVGLQLPTFDPRESFCRHPFDHFLVRWDGMIVSCSYHRFLLGDINMVSPIEIWNYAPWRRLRRRIWQQGYRIICPQCHCWQINNKDLFLHYPPNLGQMTIDLRDEKSHA